ncbi:hypothetical protein [Aequorivita sp. KMM 9714]|uniref:hypothetical protein n=1 Tax=Aequorivita sp. KMM 9714 TaxID=2707173 RepID=UPI0013EA8CB3|nr:hypothetical protein [Aequorivita sp. KMM 9714]NGX83130.1 hypothetical protein [Aequorivita sp. KMM 9714]
MKILFSIICMFVLFSCNDGNKENQKVIENKNSGFSVELIENYFPKNDIEFSSPVKTVVISNKVRFEQFFGVAKTMNNEISPIDFEENKVVALIAKPSDVKQEIFITATELKKNKLLVKYKLKQGETQSFTSADLKMFTIPKSVYAVDFVIDRDESENN